LAPEGTLSNLERFFKIDMNQPQLKSLPEEQLEELYPDTTKWVLFFRQA